MVWFVVDDTFATSPKVLRIPRADRLACIGLWTMAGAWSAQHLTDGKIPAFMVEEWGADVSHGTALVDAGLWHETSDGFEFHDWSDYQPSRADVRAKRERERTRKEEYRAKKAAERGQSPLNVPVVSQRDSASQKRAGDALPTQPFPAQPNPSIEEGGAKRAARIPEPFVVTREMREWAAREVPTVDVDAATRVFVDHWRGNGKPMKDWVATWRNWLRRDVRDGRAARAGARPSPTDRALSVVEMGRRLDAGGEQKGLSA